MRLNNKIGCQHKDLNAPGVSKESGLFWVCTVCGFSYPSKTFRLTGLKDDLFYIRLTADTSSVSELDIIAGEKAYSDLLLRKPLMIAS
jgi:hypothetical protein